ADGGDGDSGLPADGGGGDAGEACPLPSGGVYATFLVTDDVFRAHITDADAIQQAIDLWQGNSNASIPNGDLICEPADFNCGYSWHLDPENIEFAEVTVEVCDGSPSYIEDNCEDFSVDYYCPWNAELIDLRDCSEPDCPQVPRDPA
ncbi:MAG: hypothetical protein ACOCXM_10560, partial [Myxococcota bacterium]